MKKLFVALMFMGSMAQGAVTQAQAQQAQVAANELVQAARVMLNYANAVNSLFEAGFVLTVAGSTETVTIPQATQNRLIDVNRYNALKANLVDIFNQLP